MKRLKKLMAIAILATVATLGTPQAFAEDGHAESPGITVTAEATGDGHAESPGITVTAEATGDGHAESPGIVAIILDLLASIF